MPFFLWRSNVHMYFHFLLRLSHSSHCLAFPPLQSCFLVGEKTNPSSSTTTTTPTPSAATALASLTERIAAAKAALDDARARNDMDMRSLLTALPAPPVALVV